MIDRIERRSILLDSRRSHAEIWSDNMSLCQPLGAEVSGQHNRSVQKSLDGRLVRHGFDTQLHRKLHLDPVPGLPGAIQRQIATGCRRTLQYLPVQSDGGGGPKPPWYAEPDAYCLWPGRGNGDGSARRLGVPCFLSQFEPFLLPVEFRGDEQIHVQAGVVAPIDAVVELGKLLRAASGAAPESSVFRVKGLPHSGRQGQIVLG